MMKNILTPITIIIFAVSLRLVPHPANVAPIAAMALFGGAYLNKKYALIIPLIAMVISDSILGFHASISMVYTSFLIAGLLGLWVRKNSSWQRIIAASLLSSFIFFVLTNFNYWYATALYPKTLSGLLQSYYLALPFFRNSLLGDLFYTSLFFGSFQVVQHLVRKERTAIQ